eukprot:CAMPEP_0176342230 /NCGR_PEP_ID=MMETSP0126-20121128/3011_1 /TAXON_ID=141414 ORGANISM="Strombidinopsis acuminatum, Strain SPMC142" /NCGR_SAMPLE_ID=MMETSP0126 /ASSEMBLY_ACC=CAM_ASM_000229 /LENGTH=51 /DNA_ID=CAMNT_0017687521 /DNA_START=249 /DNA_END=404 /DNA_ORIENTATION=+
MPGRKKKTGGTELVFGIGTIVMKYIVDRWIMIGNTDLANLNIMVMNTEVNG